MAPDDYCGTEIGGPGSTLHYSLMFLSPATRHAACAVHAFAHEIAAVGHECHDPGVAQAKFGWWREEILRTYTGAARHPVAQALAPAIAAHALGRESFLAVIDAAAATFEHAHFDTFAALRAHCHATGAVPHLLAATVLGATDPATPRYAESLGIGLRLADILIHLGRDIRRQRLFLPLEDLRRFGIAEADLFACRHTPAFAALMAHQANRARQYLDEANASLPPAERTHQLPGLIMSAIAQAHLAELKDDDYRVLDRQLALTPIRKLWIAWRTRAAERRQRRRRA